jgi:hypothetical protein
VSVSGDHSRLFTSASGISSGEVLDGGTIRIGQANHGGLLIADSRVTPVPGYVVVQSGAKLSADGAGAKQLSFKVNNVLTPTTSVSGSGGEIDIGAVDGLLFDGKLSAAAGGKGSAGGNLNIALGTSGFGASVLTLGSPLSGKTSVSKKLAPNFDLVEELTKDEESLGSYVLGSKAGSDWNAGKGWIAPTAFSSGGFARLNFKSTDVIQFGLSSGDVLISALDSIVLQAPSIAAQVDPDSTASAAATVQAPYVKILGGVRSNPPFAFDAEDGGHPLRLSSGTSVLSIDSKAASGVGTIDLMGHTALQGFRSVNLSSSGDVRFAGLADDEVENKLEGSLNMLGNLSITSAQSYPTTMSDFTLLIASDAQGVGGNLQFVSNGRSMPAPLSIGGRLNVYAQSIDQGGKVLAPFGAINFGNLDASLQPFEILHTSVVDDTVIDEWKLASILTSAIKYRSGSVSSVAGTGRVLFGTTLNGSVPSARDWIYSFKKGDYYSIAGVQQSGQESTQRQLSSKSIVSNATSINVLSGATLDLSGGGELFGYEFTPGKGGSRDILANAENSRYPVYAIHPDYRNGVAPLDPGVLDYNAPLAPGRSVYIATGVAGLAAGSYTLLPAHYALMQGAFAVSAAPNSIDTPATQSTQLPDGVALVSGRFVNGGSNTGDTRNSGFYLMSRQVIDKKSDLAITDATTFFESQDGLQSTRVLPNDAGAVTFQAEGSSAALKLDGTINLKGKDRGRNGQASISAPIIQVVSASNGVPSTGIVTLAATTLNKMGAESLLLGGIRSASGGQVTITAGASEVVLKNDASNPLSGAELMLVAKDKIDIQSGSSLSTSATLNRNSSTVQLDGGSAFFRLTSGSGVQLNRSASTGTAATLTVASGTLFNATNGALALDTVGTLSINDDVNLSTVKSLWLGAKALAFNSTDDNSLLSSDALVLKTPRVNQLSDAASPLSWLNLVSYTDPIDVVGDLVLDKKTMELAIVAPGIRAVGSATTSLSLAKLRVSGVQSFDESLPETGTAEGGSFSVLASDFEIGNNAFALSNFTDYSFDIANAVLAKGSQGSLVADQNLTVVANQFVTTNSAAATLLSANDLTLSRSLQEATAVPAPGYGGQWRFVAGNNLVGDANVLSPSGKIELEATGALSLLTDGTLSTAGAAVDFKGKIVYGQGGTISLAGGSIDVASGSVLDVSSGGSAAGQLNLVSRDSPALIDADASLKGTGFGQQGAFSLDAYSVDSATFSALNEKLNSGGFTESRQVRARNGNILVDGNITAKEVVLAADDGDLTVTGTIDARGSKGGSIALYASQQDAAGSKGNIIISGFLQANATDASSSSGGGSAGNGGFVLLSSSNADGSELSSFTRGSTSGASIDLKTGSVIDVSGRDSSTLSVVRNGSVVLRAPRVGLNEDLGIHALSGTITGSASTMLEGVKVYTADTITAGVTGVDEEGLYNLDATSGGEMFTDAKTFGANASTILSALGAGAGVTVNPGIEVRSEGDLKISVNEFAPNAADRGWDLSGWRFGSTNADPANITLRAAGNLNIVGSISDGFIKPTTTTLAMPTWALGEDRSASLRLVGGADFLAANPMAVQSAALLSELGEVGDVTVSFAARTTASDAPVSLTDMPVSVVRTGTGRIDVAAGRDFTLAMAPLLRTLSPADASEEETVALNRGIILDDDSNLKVPLSGATMYTSGQRVSVSSAPSNAINTYFGGNTLSEAAFGSGGGAVTIVAARNINGPRQGDIKDPSSASDWFYRGLGTTAADEDDPETLIDETVAIKGENIFRMQQALPNLVNNWFFRQGRSAVDSDGKTVFAEYDKNFSEGGVGSGTLTTAWWARPDYFNQGIATFGGGDVAVRAGSHVKDLSVSAASNAHLVSDASNLTSGFKLDEMGGGDVSVRAGGDILGGAVFVQKGAGLMQSGGNIMSGNLAAQAGVAATALNPMIAAGDAKITILAARNLAIESVYNPTAAPQARQNLGGNPFADGTKLTSLASFLEAGSFWDVTKLEDPDLEAYNVQSRSRFNQYSNFFTYGSDSSVTMMSAAGDSRMINDTNRIKQIAPDQSAEIKLADGGLDKLYAYAPASVDITALSGSIKFEEGFLMNPMKTGQLELRANHSVVLMNKEDGGRALLMLDTSPSFASSVESPRLPTIADMSILRGVEGTQAHTLGGLHIDDAAAVKITALSGDVIGGNAAESLILPKRVEVFAGNDIRNLGMRIQHTRLNDVSTLTAGRDVVFPVTIGQKKSSMTFTGAGRVDVLAGKNISFGESTGLVTVGALNNPYLADSGASINLTAGTLQKDYSGFVLYVADEWGGAGLTEAQLAESTLLAAFLTKTTGVEYLSSDTTLYAAFSKLSLSQRSEFANSVGSFADLPTSLSQPTAYAEFKTFVTSKSGQVFTDKTKPDLVWAAFMNLTKDQQALYLSVDKDVNKEVTAVMAQRAARLETLLNADDQTSLNQGFMNLVRTTGKDPKVKPLTASSNELNTRYDILISKLFGSGSGGDISVFSSQLKTFQEGSIDLMSPFGSVYAGLTRPANEPANQGVFTIRGGDIRSLVRNDILVNQGRVFTLGGGDITLASQTRNIDAGRGAKTASSAPPPIIKINEQGIVEIDVSSSISGSGIATLQTREGQPDSSVYAVAPRGVFDAGDAGVRSSKDIDVVANTVLNAGNISAAGSVSGSAVAPSPPPPPPAAPASAAASQQNNTVGTANPLTPKAERTLSVELLGYGDDSGDGDGNSDDPKNPRKQKKN